MLAIEEKKGLLKQLDIEYGGSAIPQYSIIYLLVTTKEK